MLSCRKGGDSLHEQALLSTPWEKYTRAAFDAAQTQHLRGHETYSPNSSSYSVLLK